MNPQLELLNELTAYVERNFVTPHAVIIADAVEQFKQKLRLDAQESEWQKANPKILDDKDKGIFRDEYVLHYRPKSEPPPIPTVEEIQNGINFMRAGMIGIDTTNGYPKALEYFLELRKHLLRQ